MIVSAYLLDRQRGEGLTVVNRVEEVAPLLWLANVCIDEQRVRFRVDVLHHDLESVEASRLRNLHFTAESLDEVLVDNAIGCSEEGEDVADEEALVIVELVIPVWNILAEIDFFGCPKRGHSLLVHAPDLW